MTSPTPEREGALAPCPRCKADAVFVTPLPAPDHIPEPHANFTWYCLECGLAAGRAFHSEDEADRALSRPVLGEEVEKDVATILQDGEQIMTALVWREQLAAARRLATLVQSQSAELAALRAAGARVWTAADIVDAPEGWYYLRHPKDGWIRDGAVNKAAAQISFKNGTGINGAYGPVTQPPTTGAGE